MQEFLADLHVHTLASPDGRSVQKELVQAARRAGLHAIAITDHDLCSPVEAFHDGEILLIPGCEISTQAGHITGLFLHDPIDLAALGKLPPPQKAVEAIRKAGGLAVFAHPYQKPGADPEQFSFSLDGLETANARAALKVHDANQKAAVLAWQRGLPAIGGSDAHHRTEVGNAYTRIMAEELSLEALREAIVQGRCQAELKQNTSNFRKGLSQWAKARKQGGIKNLARAAAYIVYCAAKDVLRK